MSRRWLFSVLFVGLLFVLLVAGCAAPTPSNGGGLRHFGFVAVDCGWDDPADGTLQTNYLAEVAGFSNVAQLCPFALREDLGPRLKRFRRAGVKAIVTLEGVLFESTPDTSSPTGERLRLLSDAEARWQAFLGVNRAWLTPEYVAALYIVDEPTWRGASASDVSRAVAYVAASLPELPTMFVEAYAALVALEVPLELDWLGFDSFGHADPRWLADLATVRAARTRPDQRLVIVADTQWYPQYASVLGLSENDTAGVIRSYAEVAWGDPDVALLIGYSWLGGLDGPEQRGARDLPANVQQVFREIGERVRH